MNRKHTLFSIALAMFFVIAAGCIPPLSLNPLYTDKDIMYDSDIVGSWSKDNLKEVWQFTKGTGVNYNLKILAEDGTTAYIVHLLKIKDMYYIDAYPDLKAMDSAHKNLNLMMIPAHSFYQIKITENSLDLAIPDQGWIKKYLAEYPDAVPYDLFLDEINIDPKDADPMVLLTASTEQLQNFIIKIQNEKEAFEKGVNIKLQRLKSV